MRTTTVWGLLALLAITATAFGQEESDRPADGDRPDREGQREQGPRDGDRGPREGERPDPRGFGPPGSPRLMFALDTNRDGELSAEEIAQAVAALKKLDRNEDGIIDRQELRPEGLFGRGGGPRPDGDRPEGARPPREGDRPPREGERDADRGPRAEGDRGPRPDGDRGPREEGDRGPRPEGERGFRGGEGRGGRGFGGPGRPEGGAEFFVDRLMEADADGDGKLSREELLKGLESMRPAGGRGGRGDREGGSERPPRPE